ncbi:hypothetical protein A3C91_00665 [Candidatus Azambacteria bacterium RIFCSPHIGHO2_02_FULL_52_12]|uniref:NadR/Ttd14 AAA domain-containing protein n=1 Tax=Candidatus Azambacteria bacterium RIFCSPLOWO2_01_FULL_46_25 TaxID=1797298 RepID=A0A1F5BTJ2_9BACT|nr:MAG: hypothetical protein A3C91_00665 [Candidatus Azambacteria bacterium RIFCSPHIGHO2_02_FULL_52_12]OGD33937.1 MAG: hypothetical protein A2988_00385 [Candidatus Azambacteria bacterium RIFCSPLOWO2_01_FULL_46_25]OGD37722.1 MAG: hypothetical protein A2850_04305 [Candidatus Azambacteria bacterium RIFCSPHIGHO2_01_FULL_51_74]
MNIRFVKKYVLTGGPGVGKSSVIETLAQKGYCVVSETARTPMEEEHVKKSDILPSKNLQKFQEVVAKRQFEVPAFSVEERVAYILDAVRA